MVAEGMKASVEGLLRSREARRSSLQEIKVSLGRALDGCRRSLAAERARQEEARKELFATLRAGRAALSGEVRSFLQGGAQARSDQARARLALLRKGAREQRTQVQKGMLIERKSRIKVASQLRKDLLEHRAGVQRGVQGLHLHGAVDQVRHGVEQLRRDVAQTRSAMQAELAQARVEWQRTVAAPVTTPSSAPPAAEVATKEGLPGRIFAYLADHPDGVRMRELEERLGVSSSHVTRALRTLEEEGKIRRGKGIYFAR